MKNLIVDVGNSSAKVALFDGDTLIEQVRATHDTLPQALNELAESMPIEAAIISSVIPLSSPIEEALKALPCPCLHMSAQLKMPFKLAYKTPDTLGPDRLAAVAEACVQQPGATCLSLMWVRPSPTIS